MNRKWMDGQKVDEWVDEWRSEWENEWMDG